MFCLATWSWVAAAGAADNWKADWDKTVEAAKKEGQIVLYGSADFETLYAEFHKKYPEIRVTGVFGRGADVAKRLMSERRAEKYLADLYVNGQTTGYNVFYKAKLCKSDINLNHMTQDACGNWRWQGRVQGDSGAIPVANQTAWAANGTSGLCTVTVKVTNQSGGSDSVPVGVYFQ